MNYGMAIRAHRAKVANRIHLVLTADCRQRNEVMNMYEPGKRRTVLRTKVETTNTARRPVMREAPLPCQRASFVRIHENSRSRAFQ